MTNQPPEKKSNIPNASDLIDNPMIGALDAQGIDITYLTKKLKKELNAKEQKVFNDKGEIVYSDKMITWKTRQEARKDAHKLRGDYPAERKELSGKLTLEEVIKELEDDET